MNPFKLAALGSTAALLAACGGGSDPAPAAAPSNTTGNPSATPSGTQAATLEGVYAGQVGGLRARFVVLENNETHVFAGTEDATGAFTPTGWSYGTSTVNGSSFTSTLQDSTITGSFDGVNASGTINVANPPLSAPLAVSKSAVSGYTYNQPASLADITGTWQRTTGTAAPTFTISPTGTFSGSSADCTFSVALTPRPSGKNIFNVSIVGGGTCAGASASGLGLTYRDNINRQHLVAVTRLGGMSFFFQAER